MSERLGGWIATSTGRPVFPLDPRKEDLSLKEIAESLAKVCRWAGHCKKFYSVAEHSVQMAKVALLLGDREAAKWCLLHDAAEAYCGDQPRPIKANMWLVPGGDEPDFENAISFRQLEEKYMQCLAEKYDLTLPMPCMVGELDDSILATEWSKLVKVKGGVECDLDFAPKLECEVRGLSWEDARDEFIAMAHLLGLKD